jgi:hypothetical protein
VVAVGTGFVVVGADDGRVVEVERPEPPEGTEDGRDVLVVDCPGPLVVVVVVVVEEEEEEEELVGAPVSVSAGAVVVVVVEEGMVVVVVVDGSDGGVVVGVVLSVVEVVPGSGSPRSATAEAAGKQARAVKKEVRARARPTRISNTRITSLGIGSGSNGATVEHIGRQRSFVTKRNVPK